eukprot:Selendium_serpulae@DN5157_c0_g1_i3.p1
MGSLGRDEALDQARQDNVYLHAQLAQMQENCAAMCEEYERQLKRIETHGEKLTEAARRKVFKELDPIICRETTLASEAISVAKKEKRQVDIEKRRAQKLAE